MGEIVRVLKWRLDLDSAGMAEGVEKAATSAERLAAAATEVGEKGTAGLKKTAAAAKETDSAFADLGYEAQQVEMYVSRLEKGSGSPLVLKRNAELAEVAFNVLAASAQKVGQAIPEAFSDRVIVAIQKGTTQAAAMNAELEKMGGQTPTKLDKVIVALEKTATEADSARAAMATLGEAGQKVIDAFNRMEGAADSPRTLVRESARLSVAIEEVEQHIKDATRAGQQMGPGVSASLDLLKQKADAAAVTARKLADAEGDARTKGDLAAKGFEAAAGAAGSLEGMLGRLIDTGGPASQAIAEIGFKIVALSAAAKLGYTEGTKLREILVSLGVPLPNFSDRLGEAVVNMDKFARGSGEMRSITEAFSGSLIDVTMKLALLAAGYGRLEQPESAAIKRAREHLALREQQAKAEQALQAYFSTAGVAWKDGYQELDKFNAALAAGEDRLKKAMATEQGYNLELKANGALYADLIAKAPQYGIAVEKAAGHVKAAADAYKESEEAKKKATEEFASKAIVDLAKVEAAHQKVASAAAAATDKAVSTYNDQMKALNDLTVSEEEYSARKKAIYADMMSAIEKASAEEQASARATAVEQKKVQEALETTPERYAAVEKAASAYNEAIAKGATPNAAMKKTIEELSIGLFDVAKAMESVSEISKSLDGSVTVPFKDITTAAGEAFKSLEGMKSTSLSLISMNGQLEASNRRLAGSFREVQAAAAGAAGGGTGGSGDYSEPPTDSGSGG